MDNENKPKRKLRGSYEMINPIKARTDKDVNRVKELGKELTKAPKRRKGRDLV